jgi:hypothetical protein
MDAEGWCWAQTSDTPAAWYLDVGDVPTFTRPEPGYAPDKPLTAAELFPFGPMRPVVTDAHPHELDRLTRLLIMAERSALTTAAAVLCQLVAASRPNVLVGGGGSSAAAAALDVLHREVGHDLDPRRVHPGVAAHLGGVLVGWVGGGGLDPYTEVAANLGRALAMAVDDRQARGGWGPTGFGAVTDELVIRHPAAETLRRWALATSITHGPR